MKVQAYVRRVRGAGGSVNSKIVIAGAKGILLAYNRLLLSNYGGPVMLNQLWGHSLLTRMKFVRRKGTTAKSKHSIQHFDRLRKNFLEELKTIVAIKEVSSELIMNWDQAGIKIVPSSLWTLEKCGSQLVEIIGTDDKRQFTAVFCGTLLGEFLPPQLI